MPEYQIEITETSSCQVVRKADCLDDAIQDVRSEYRKGEIVLSDAHFIGVTFEGDEIRQPPFEMDTP